jgi:hypothetical protein
MPLERGKSGSGIGSSFQLFIEAIEYLTWSIGNERQESQPTPTSTFNNPNFKVKPREFHSFSGDDDEEVSAIS